MRTRSGGEVGNSLPAVDELDRRLKIVDGAPQGVLADGLPILKLAEHRQRQRQLVG